jgi:hypothetical protein
VRIIVAVSAKSKEENLQWIFIDLCTTWKLKVNFLQVKVIEDPRTIEDIQTRWNTRGSGRVYGIGKQTALMTLQTLLPFASIPVDVMHFLYTNFAKKLFLMCIGKTTKGFIRRSTKNKEKQATAKHLRPLRNPLMDIIRKPVEFYCKRVP